MSRLRTLKARIIFLFLLIFLPLLVLAVWAGLQTYRETRDTAGVEALRVAHLAVANHQALIEGTRQLLTTLGAVPAVHSADHAACSQFLAMVLRDNPRYGNLGIIENDGYIRCSALPIPEPVFAGDRAYYLRAVQNGTFAVGDYQIGRITGQPGINFGYPLYDESHQLAGVLFTALDLAWLNEFAGIVELPEGGSLLVVDPAGTVLARYPEPAFWVGRSFPDADVIVAVSKGKAGEFSVQEVAGLDGVSRVYAFSPLATGTAADPFIAIGISTEQAFASAVRQFLGTITGTLLVFGLLFLIAWRFANITIVRHLQEVQRLSHRIAQGDLAARLEQAPPVREFEALNQDLNTMAQALEAHEAERSRQLNQLRLLRSIDQTILENTELTITLQTILEELRVRLAVDAVVMLYNTDLDILEFGAQSGMQTEALQHTRLPLGQGYAGRAARERRLIFIPDLVSQPGELARSPLLGEEGFRAYHALPLISKGELMGVLEVFHRHPLVETDPDFSFFEAIAGQIAIAVNDLKLLLALRESNLELIRSYDLTLEGWARALELRDQETEGHTRRVTQLSLQLAGAVGVPDDQLSRIRYGALLHDIGKMGISDAILLKPGPLTEEEWGVMQRHPQYAYDLLKPIGFLAESLEIPLSHHEKWDGSGYPQGLQGEAIPLYARIFAVVDVFDALTSDRPYRKAWPRAKAVAYIEEQSGVHFDPRIAAAFLKMVRSQE